jgi:caa(3)-type oxidase subunit IV
MSIKSVSLTTTLVTGAVLIALWIASWALSGLELGAWSFVVALGIAGVKAALVVLLFMEIIVESLSIRIALATGATMIALLIGLMVLDVQTRWPPLQIGEGAASVR